MHFQRITERMISEYVAVKANTIYDPKTKEEWKRQIRMAGGKMRSLREKD